MGFMQKDQHIDAELFALLLCSGGYRQYAERYMAEELRGRLKLLLILADVWRLK